MIDAHGTYTGNDRTTRLGIRSAWSRIEPGAISNSGTSRTWAAHHRCSGTSTATAARARL